MSDSISFSFSRLTRLLLLIDAEKGITDTDNIALDMLEEFKRPYVVREKKIEKIFFELFDFINLKNMYSFSNSILALLKNINFF